MAVRKTTTEYPDKSLVPGGRVQPRREGRRLGEEIRFRRAGGSPVREPIRTREPSGSTSWGGPPGPRPTPSSASAELAASGFRGTRADRGGRPVLKYVPSQWMSECSTYW